MIEPQPFGWFHILCLAIMFVAIYVCWCARKKHSEFQLKLVLGFYAVPTLILEILKQLSWSMSMNNGEIVWDYQWYAFPFQLCTTPLIVCLICLFLKKGLIRNALLSYVAFITILGSIAVIVYPTDCFVEDILINIHTTYLHFGSFVVSCYLLFTKEVKIKWSSYIQAVSMFIIFAVIANCMNIFIYQSGILHGETFNMFYISPYFISNLPVFNQIQQEVPYLLFFFIYLFALSCGSLLIYSISYAAKCLMEFPKKHKHIC
jgi:hypothetical protein